MDPLADWLEFVIFLVSLHIIKISRSCLRQKKWVTLDQLFMFKKERI